MRPHMTTTAGKPGVRARQQALQATIADLQRELVELSLSMGGLHATLIAVLAQKGGEVTITPGTIKQVSGAKFGFSMTPGPQEGEMTLRVVTEPDPDELPLPETVLADDVHTPVTVIDQHDSVDNVLDMNGERVE